MVVVAVVLIPGVPLGTILFLTQAFNAVLLAPLLIRMARDEDVMGRYRSGRVAAFAYAVTIAVVVASVAALLVLTVS